MSSGVDDHGSLSNRQPQFATTHWSLVVQGGKADSPKACQALAQLCEIYWYPLYAYVRRRGYSADQAQDLTQAFFAFLLEKRTIQVADPERGKFRSFLLASMQHFLAKEWRGAQSKKRGGGQPPVPFHLEGAEACYQKEPAHEWTPERILERRWALTLLEQALNRLHQEYVAAGKEKLFSRLRDCLGDERGASYREMAQAIGMTEGALKVAVHRMRQRYRELLREEVAQTLETAADVDEELRYLFQVLGN